MKWENFLLFMHKSNDLHLKIKLQNKIYGIKIMLRILNKLDTFYRVE